MPYQARPVGAQQNGVTEAAIAIPGYLQEVYWWAYVHPRAVRVFERQWLVNAILWGNFARLRDAALEELQPGTAGRILQIACVYGDLTARLCAGMGEGAALDVVDVLPVQLGNLRSKLPAGAAVTLLHRDSIALGFDTASYDRALIFFLLHEQPAPVRRKTLAEAVRVVRPGGRIVVVDYHGPAPWHPLAPLLRPVLRRLEPYALDLWRYDIEEWLPHRPRCLRKQTYFGGLYQKVVIEI
jgi:ubiquinone/menaquinone biosynthesis C-methylase UbiE